MYIHIVISSSSSNNSTSTIITINKHNSMCFLPPSHTTCPVAVITMYAACALSVVDACTASATT